MVYIKNFFRVYAYIINALRVDTSVEENLTWIILLIFLSVHRLLSFGRMTISHMKWIVLGVLCLDEQSNEVLLMGYNLPLDPKQIAWTVRKPCKDSRPSASCSSKVMIFSFRPLFACILKTQYLRNKGASAGILLRFLLPHWGLLIAKRWDAKGLNMLGSFLVSARK